MASSMLGERRRVSARRGGAMTVLGKVAVPKPVNLPSQRLENQGLDPNVEIVPKGTLSWGSRTSSSPVNAWGSSMLSSNSADGSGGSPGRLNARPSSGGSGTRPSTAGSDRSIEPSSSAWGPSSRPSSASGLLASSQSSVGSLRPRSAETRPGSSQRSRFAESVVENSVTRGGLTTSEGLGSAFSKPSSFTLSSGDFPTLGSEKCSETNARQGHSSHGQPSSSSSVAVMQERSESSSCDDGSMDPREKEDVSTWKRGDSVLHHGGPPPHIEKWQRDNHQGPSCQNTNVPPHHFDPWHGAPIRNHPPDGGWYRGGPPPGPYGPAPSPGGFGLEPPLYGYYHPQPHVPGHSVPNSLSAPRPRAGPGGFHTKSGDSYRPLPDSYGVPGPPVMPVRYPGPIPPYDGYYGPPRMNYRNSSEHDAPSAMGMAGGPGPCVYNRYPKHNARPDSANFHIRPGGYGPPSATTKEPIETGIAHDPTHHGQYKVLLKQHESWGDSEAVEKREHSAVSPHVERGSSPVSSPMRGNGMKEQYGNTCPTDYPKTSFAEEALVEPINNQGEQSIAIVTQNLMDKTIKIKSFEGDLVKEPEMSFITAEGTNPLPTPSDEVLVGGHPRGVDGSSHGITVAGESRPGEPSSMEAGEKSYSQFQRRGQWVQSRADHRGKAKPSVHESEEWRKKSPPMPEPSLTINTIDSSSHEAPGEQNLSNPEKVGEVYNATDYEAQRAKMKEIATQRAKQLQKEEEERIREQKAKAMAKLEELNKRTAESSDVKSSTNRVQHQLDEARAPLMQIASVEASGEAQACDTVSKLGVVTQTSNKAMDKPGVSIDFSSKKPIGAPLNALLNPVQLSTSSVPLGQDVNSTESTLQKSPSQFHDNVSLKQKQIGYRKKQSDSREKSQDNKSTTLAKDHATASSEANSATSIVMEDTSLQHKKKHSRNGKNKHKLEDGPSDTDLALTPLEAIPVKLPAESGKLKPALPVLIDTSAAMIKVNMEGQSFPSDVVSEGQGLAQSMEETHGNRMNYLWKLHPNRRMPRSTQVSWPMDKFHGSESVVWAPVKSTSKQESCEEAHLAESHNQCSGTGADGVSNNLKSRRAERERYVPKPVVKELSQQSSSQQPPQAVSSLQATSDDTAKTGRSDVTGKVHTLDTKNGESKNNKHVKAHTSWRQRSLIDSSVVVHYSHGGSASSTDMVKPIQKPNDQTRPIKLDGYSPKEQGHSDNRNVGKTQSAEPVSIYGVKDHGAPNRGKRQQSKLNQGGVGHFQSTSCVANNAADSAVANKTSSQTTTFELSESDGKGVLRSDNEVIVERGSSHWQPKTQTTHQNRHGTRVNGGQKFAGQVVRTIEKDYGSQDQSHHPIQPDIQKPTATDIASSHEKEREKKVADSFKEEAINIVQQHPEDSDLCNEQRLVLSGARKQGQHQGQFSRGHNGASYEGGGRVGPWQESHRHQIASQGERRKQNNLHYEYQPVGSYHKSNDSSHYVLAASEESVGENTRHLGARYREHGQNYSRRGGHFPGRNRNANGE
ncbi:protein MODIFIER OF SNC1 1-like isoform X2 [Aristolochia californica]|uniref:protein MODIFIER OF SNC1 1-like isoform X2 n=1 Tax=Aristolochia californica TaxID=171875 RepID=UPI0035D80457